VSAASVKRLDTASGHIEHHSAEQEDDHVLLKLTLPPRGHELLLVSDIPASAPAKRTATVRNPVSLSLRTIRRVRENLLYVDYCDLEAYSQRSMDINTAAADALNWRWQGFEGNPWFMQFQRTLIDRPTQPDTGFTVTYRFSIASEILPAALHTLQLAIERPELYRLDLNGKALDTRAGKRWFDERVVSIPIGSAVTIGENVLTLAAQPFHMLCGIMPVYIIGDFSLAPAERGFVIHDPIQLELGDWTTQGMPFYPDAVRYEHTFNLTHESNRLIVRVPEWRGSVVAVQVDGRHAGVVMHPPYECPLPGPFHADEHTVAVDVLGNMQSMMGSHHHHGLPLRGAFEFHSPKHMPPGTDYKVFPAGLLDHIELFEERAQMP